MTNCKELNIVLCPACLFFSNQPNIKGTRLECWIDHYKYDLDILSKNKDPGKEIKKIMLREPNRYLIYLSAAIEIYYPQYIELYKKLAILI